MSIDFGNQNKQLWKTFVYEVSFPEGLIRAFNVLTFIVRLPRGGYNIHCFPNIWSPRTLFTEHFIGLSMQWSILWEILLYQILIINEDRDGPKTTELFKKYQ